MTWGPRGLEFAFVLLASWLVANALIQDEFTQSPLSATMDTEQKPLISSADVQLKNVDLFGKATSESLKKVAKDEPVKVSKLNIKLIGTVVAGAKSAAMVMRNGKQDQEVYFLGESIQPNVELIEVSVLEIVINNAGKKEHISLEMGAAIANPTPVINNRAKRGRPKPTRHEDRKIDRGHLQNQMRNFSTLLSQARVTPHFTDKKADGFTISDIVKGSLYEEIGLINGDVIQKVNGESVTSAEQAMRMYRELQNSTFIDVEIVRNGSVQQVSYTIQ